MDKFTEVYEKIISEMNSKSKKHIIKESNDEELVDNLKVSCELNNLIRNEDEEDEYEENNFEEELVEEKEFNSLKEFLNYVVSTIGLGVDHLSWGLDYDGPDLSADDYETFKDGYSYESLLKYFKDSNNGAYKTVVWHYGDDQAISFWVHE